MAFYISLYTHIIYKNQFVTEFTAYAYMYKHMDSVTNNACFVIERQMTMGVIPNGHIRGIPKGVITITYRKCVHTDAYIHTHV